MITVAELIAELKKLPADLPVIVLNEDGKGDNASAPAALHMENGWSVYIGPEFWHGSPYD